MKIVSFDVDAQKGFTPICPEELPVPGGGEIVPALNEMADLADLRIGSKDAHPRNAVWVVEKSEEMLAPLDYPEADLTWVRHCVPGTDGFEQLEGLPEPNQYDYFVWKGMEPDLHPYGACYHDISEHLSTGVIEFLRAERVELILVGGLAFDFCVKTTILQLLKNDFEVVVYLPATRALTKEGESETRVLLEQAENVSIAHNYQELAAFCRK
ncbi:isochorismatase family protein [Listeria ilorinensis]|uniref:isochorismatase family protein n=1 Tax=Listeria ilorinensis TaxID=2867439 RepID=UPI001EF57C33|nr:isochorismatase family protein [Listeria ilorinensis]